MSTPRFSIVIPTRERPHTLEHTLATCLAQNGPEFEVVVSDNWSGPATRELVERRADPRVRYVRTSSLLAMTDSLEFAVSQARGEYVIIQGDDDGLLRHALPAIEEVLRATNTRLLRWESAVYNWPDLNNPYFQPDALLLPLMQTRTGHALRVCNSRKMIRAAANGHVAYSELPVIYNAVIHRDLLDRLRARTGRVFKSRTPDVHAAFALAALVDEYHSLRAPLGICGRSGASTGVARHFGKKGSAIDNEFRRLNSAAGLELHPWVPDLPPIPSAVADAFLWARRELFPDDGELVLDRAQLIRNCLREMEVDTADEWREVQASCRRALADAPDLLAWFEREYGGREFTTLERPNRSHHWRRYGDGYLHLNAAEFGVRTVDGAAELCERLLGYRHDGVPFRLEAFESGATSLSELQEKEALLQRLNSLCQQLRRDNDLLTQAVEVKESHLQQHLRAAERQHAEIQRQNAEIQRQNAEIERRNAEIESLTRILNRSWSRRIRRLSRRLLSRLAGK
jgi:glycosyltransferase involved in cell wall biosynthesis